MSSPITDVFADAARAFDACGARWYLFGAQAAILYGVARLTADVDFTVDGAVPRQRLVQELTHAGFQLRVADVDDFVARTRVLPFVHVTTRVPVDVVLSGPGLEELFFQRAQTRIVDGVKVRLACAEDIVAMKILAGRSKDLEDAAAIIGAAGDHLQSSTVEATLALLEEALDQRDLLPQLRAIVSRAKRG